MTELSSHARDPLAGLLGAADAERAWWRGIDDHARDMEAQVLAYLAIPGVGCVIADALKRLAVEWHRRSRRYLRARFGYVTSRRRYLRRGRRPATPFERAMVIVAFMNVDRADRVMRAMADAAIRAEAEGREPCAHAALAAQQTYRDAPPWHQGYILELPGLYPDRAWAAVPLTGRVATVTSVSATHNPRLRAALEGSNPHARYLALLQGLLEETPEAWSRRRTGEAISSLRNRAVRRIERRNRPQAPSKARDRSKPCREVTVPPEVLAGQRDPDRTSDPDAVVSAWADREALHEMLRSSVGLSPRELEVFDLRKSIHPPMKYREIAEQLGLKTGTIGPLLGKAERKLAKWRAAS